VSPVVRPIPIAPGNGLRRPPKKAEIVARQLVRDIVRSGRQPGTALASEGEMLEQYGTSRESLREALRILEVQGLVSIRRGPGGGPSVCTVDPANLGRMSALYYEMAGASYRELFEGWVVCESILARRAALNPDTEARVAAMSPYLLDGDAGPPADDDIESFMRDHMSFHGHVAALGRNRALELTLQAMGQIVSHHVEVTDDPRALGRDLGDDHRRIAVAIVSGAPGPAAALMEEHVVGMTQVAGEHLGARMDDLVEWQ
jgi:GntR family transcriptional regulator, transcriptional repressor for pyruvate dehydrogenase complex